MQQLSRQSNPISLIQTQNINAALHFLPDVQLFLDPAILQGVLFTETLPDTDTLQITFRKPLLEFPY